VTARVNQRRSASIEKRHSVSQTSVQRHNVNFTLPRRNMMNVSISQEQAIEVGQSDFDAALTFDACSVSLRQFSLRQLLNLLLLW
jgi:hypothetical protein